MGDVPGYWRDPYRVELETEVVETGTNPDGRPWAVLVDTILYPEGGGQPFDLGTVGGVPVAAVSRQHGRTLHLLERPLGSGPTVVRLDWPRRFDHMQQHTAQHLLTAVAEDRFGWPTTAFHLGPEVSDVELGVPRLGGDRLRDLEAAVAIAVRAALPVSERRTTVAEMAAEGARCRGLPEDLEGEVRLVEIRGTDLAACGGTHLRSTAEIECVCLLAAEGLRGGTRVHFVAGGRVRRRMGQHEARNASLRSVLGAPDGELTAAATAKLEQLQALSRAQKRLTTDLGAALARDLAASGEAVVAHHLTAGGQELMQAIARHLPGTRFSGFALLTSDSGHFALVSGDEGGRLPELGRLVAEVLGGRGGGAGRQFQGRAESIHRHAEAFEMLRRAAADVKAAPPAGGESAHRRGSR